MCRRIIMILKKYSSHILIITGVIIISFFLVMKVRNNILQRGITGEYNRESEENKVITVESIPANDAAGSEAENKQNDTAGRKDGVKTVNRSEYKDGMMVIDIKKIKLRANVMNGTTPAVLKKGPGLFEVSGLPDTEGENVCIAGHLNVYKQEFRHIDSLVKGDLIKLEFNSKCYTYEVEKKMTVGPKDWSITKKTGYSSLTLMTCHPVYRTKKRLVVRAKLIGVESM